MEIKHYHLGAVENNRFIKIVKVLFGFVCIIVAIIWIIFKVNTLNTEGTLWLSIGFLLVFGLYQIWSGLGRAARFIEIAGDYINLRKNQFLPAVRINASEVKKIELFPLSLVFFLRSDKKILLRFGTTFYETNEIIKDEISLFAERNNIALEFIEEKI